MTRAAVGGSARTQLINVGVGVFVYTRVAVNRSVQQRTAPVRVSHMDAYADACVLARCTINAFHPPAEGFLTL